MPTVVQPTEAKAREEAERLCKKTGVNVILMESVARVEPPAEPKLVWKNIVELPF